MGPRVVVVKREIYNFIRRYYRERRYEQGWRSGDRYVFSLTRKILFSTVKIEVMGGHRRGK